MIDKAQLLALVASNVYAGGDTTLEDSISIASEIIATAAVECKREERDAAATPRAPRRQVRQLAGSDEDVPF
jgi:hypothetical protein